MRRGLFLLLFVAACGSAAGTDTTPATAPDSALPPDTVAASEEAASAPASSPNTAATESSQGQPDTRTRPSTTPSTASVAPDDPATDDRPAPAIEGRAIAQHGSIGVIGCSQTRDAIAGYNALAPDNRFGATSDARYLSGASIEVWAQPNSRKWSGFDALVGSQTDALWIMICWHFQRSVDADVAMVETVIDRAIDAIGGEVPVYISGLNDWDPRDLCRRGDYPASAALADQVAAEGLAIRGPDLGPLQRQHTDDGCHGNREGNALMGAQLIEFFG